MKNYGEAHRAHMNYEIEHQDRQWRRLNVRNEERYWMVMELIGTVAGITAFAFFATLAVYWWSK